jgi:hypothetical protein
MYRQADQNRLVDDTHSKAHWQQVAREAQDAFEFASQHADQFTQDYIRDLGQTATTAAETAANWGSSLGGSLDEESGKVRALSGEFITLEEQAKRASQGFSYTVDSIDQYTIDKTPGGADALLAQLSSLGHTLGSEKAAVRSIDDQNRYMADLARYNALRESYDLLVSQSKKKGSARDGAVGDFGDGTLMELHGLEAIVPLNRQVGQQALGGVNLTFYVNGTAEDSARKISDILMRQLKQTRQFGAA